MTLFPEIDAEIAQDRTAARREQQQRSRIRLQKRDFTWTANQLLERGPSTEHELLVVAMDYDATAVNSLDILTSLHDLWVTKKAWRESVGRHPGSGEQSYRYGLCGVHPKP